MFYLHNVWQILVNNTVSISYFLLYLYCKLNHFLKACFKQEAVYNFDQELLTSHHCN